MRTISIKFGLAFGVTLLPTVSLASENKANDYLLSVTPKQQAELLGKVVGEGCIGKISFYQGSMDDRGPRPKSATKLPGHEHDAHWSVKCTNGKSFLVSVSPTGAGQVLECSVLEAVGGGHCFKKYE
jgi:hypothetical protein